MTGELESKAVGVDQLAEAGRKAAVDAAAKVELAQAAIEIRDRYVLQLYDAGESIARVAEIMLVSRSRVHQIVAAKG